jgi:hypothetical protein
MKLRIIILNHKYIISFFVLILLLIGLIFLFNNYYHNQTPVFEITNDYKLIKSDLTGDGLEDMLYIKTENNKYYLQVNSNNDSFFLEPDKKINSNGYFSKYWPMRITLMDISRDKTPEIFIQSSEKNKPIQHIFRWSGSGFKDIFCSNNNIIGFIDTKNNKTPKFISGNIKDSSYNFSYYMLLENNIQQVSYNSEIPGINAIITLIYYIETLPIDYSTFPRNIFLSSLQSNDLSAIDNLYSQNCTYSFQDGLFMDSKCDKNGNISQVNWTLNFKSTSKDSTTVIKNAQIDLKLIKDSNDGIYRIFYINRK